MHSNTQRKRVGGRGEKKLMSTQIAYLQVHTVKEEVGGIRAQPRQGFGILSQVRTFTRCLRKGASRRGERGGTRRIRGSGTGHDWQLSGSVLADLIFHSDLGLGVAVLAAAAVVDSSASFS